ncbi:unnamed protein product [Rotaria sp. Silwood2]|nr:unnamed protein product [Rotaria sp. Silwood2]CAF3066128.1 unnamed protein product [Rotaria sp. Silwood2]CAF3128643.1 unnamed protein product [Rotaria sp. Silwood2]CAF4200638.1 unnamed protein product [Rotaria sp. Silwood2]CAF4232496.1 unnamed protein product [Rotaria sp. Silwood2]
MINKKGTTYRQMFFGLKQIAEERHKDFSPQLIVTDFESGALPVVKTEFPSSRHYGCNFHFCQAIFRQIQQLDLQQQYSRDEVVRGLCRKIMSLAMMPIDTVLVGYDEIRNDAQQLPGSPIEPLLNYFEKQWLSDINCGMFQPRVPVPTIYVKIRWSSGASKKLNVRTTGKQGRIDTLYQRYNGGLINSSQFLTGLSYLVGNKI